MTSRLLLAFCLTATLSTAQDRVEAWGEDLIFLYEKIQEHHPDPFYSTSQEEFEAAIDEIYGRLPELTDDQAVVELMRFMALLSRDGKDGHSGLRPVATFHSLPLRLYRFSDGWFVFQAQDEELVGQRLVALDGTPVEEVCEEIRPLLNRDNDTDLLARLARPLVMTELLHALGLTRERTRVTLRLEASGGKTTDRTLDGLSPERYLAWAGSRPPLLLPVEGALWLSNGHAAWWTKVLPEERSLYAQYNVVARANPAGERVGEFGAEIVRLFEEHELERVVVDMRLNGGGDNTTFGPLIESLKENERLNSRGRLYGLIGRHTFSAAGNFASAFDNDLNSILVGEPTGGGPNQYGDARSVTLPHHPELIVRISTRWHEFAHSELRG